MQDVQGEETKDIEMKKDTIIQKKKIIIDELNLSIA